eukprot:TRINITY_DN8850_c0_g1_i1.p1 TRINITY_DN8850_c0_g1~~TRINITY_DN8850_c0_g1_i1.p1  ORF type:complete len:316 (-),score=73.10 TRINITY_DN8850_c0_g1_i1:81-1028(-)
MVEEWQLDAVVGFLRSPLWETPIHNFIDKNCTVFDNEEENKFEYTPVHEEYKKLVEKTLETHLIENSSDSSMQLTAEKFLEACQAAAPSPSMREVLDLVLATEDFLLFKRIMFQRNLQLDLEAIAKTSRKLKSEGIIETASFIKGTDIETRNLEEAIRLSKELFANQNLRDKFSDEELKKAVAMSLQDKEMMEKLGTQENDLLEQAIQASLNDLNIKSSLDQTRVLEINQKRKTEKDKLKSEELERQKRLELEKQQKLLKEREQLASVAVDKLFSRHKFLDEGDIFHDEVKEERGRILQQKNKERDDALKEYPKK